MSYTGDADPNDVTDNILATKPKLPDGVAQGVDDLLQAKAAQSPDGTVTTGFLTLPENFFEPIEPFEDYFALDATFNVPITPIVFDVPTNVGAQVISVASNPGDFLEFDISGLNFGSAFLGGSAGEYIISNLPINSSALARDAQLNGKDGVPVADPDSLGLTVDGGGGDDTIETGEGNDSVNGGAGIDSVSTGSGNDLIGSGENQDSVDGGTGWDTMVMADKAYSFSVVDGEVFVRSQEDGASTTSANVEYIDLGDAGAIVNASTREDATAARQAEAILGEQLSSDELRAYNELVNEVGLDDASGQLMTESGFDQDTADLTDAEYINLLYQQTFGRDAGEEGLTFYGEELASGRIDRAKLAADLAWSDEGVDSNDMVNTIDGMV